MADKIKNDERKQGGTMAGEMEDGEDFGDLVEDDDGESESEEEKPVTRKERPVHHRQRPSQGI